MNKDNHVTKVVQAFCIRHSFIWILPVLIIAGCSSTGPSKPADTDVKSEIVFPEPPEEPRFYFEGSLFSSADLTPATAESRLRMLITGERSRGEGFGKPFDVSVCKGKVFVSDTVLRTVRIFDFAGQRSYDLTTDEEHPLAKPLGIATDLQCNLYIADATFKQIAIYDQEGKWISSLAEGMFNRLSHVTVTPDGKRLFAVDTGGVNNEEHRVRVFDVATGKHLYDIGTRGTGEGEFNLPRDIEIGSDGLLYIIDGANFRVQVLTQDGEFVTSYGQVGRQYGMFSRPKGVATGPLGHIYVSDAAFGNFQIFRKDGQLLLFVGGRSEKLEPAKYMLPAGIDVDEDGRVFMVDQYFRKVDIYRPAALKKTDGYLGSWYGKKDDVKK